MSRKNLNEIELNGVNYSDKSTIAEIMNDFFSNVASKLDSNFAETRNFTQYAMSNPNPRSMFICPASIREISKIVMKLKIVKTCVNNISVFVFKRIFDFIQVPLCKIINMCIQNCIFPDTLKIARLTPIFKKGNEKEPNNYRPIASLPFLSKILERLLYDRILSFATSPQFPILSPIQFGFRKGIGTCDALISLTDNIYQTLDDKFDHICIALDLQKAFDTVNHKILLQKLSHYGIRGPVLRLFESYLDNRVQYVQIGNFKSKSVGIKIGLPQGSILGPLLFLFYINDLPNVSKKLNSILFADDTMLSYKSPKKSNPTAILNEQLGFVSDWMSNNRLTINVSKSAQIYFSTQHCVADYVFSINGRVLENVERTTYLGVTIDKNLSFSSHTQLVTSKISKAIGIFYKIRDYLPIEARISYYYAFIYPYLSYCVEIWGGTYSIHLKNLKMQQKRMIRLIAQVSRLSHTSPIFKRFNILKFDDIYKYKLVLRMFRCGESFRCNHTVETRNISLAVPVFHRLTKTQNAFSYQGPHAWNNLPNYIKCIRTETKFKKMVREFYIGAYS